MLQYIKFGKFWNYLSLHLIRFGDWPIIFGIV
jgi:hypothetical protein